MRIEDVMLLYNNGYSWEQIKSMSDAQPQPQQQVYAQPQQQMYAQPQPQQQMSAQPQQPGITRNEVLSLIQQVNTTGAVFDIPASRTTEDFLDERYNYLMGIDNPKDDKGGGK